MKKWKLALAILAIPMVVLISLILLNVYRNCIDLDPLEETARDTHRMLRNYERTGDPRELRGMFAYPPDAGGGTAAMMIIGEWAITHQKDFICIIDGLHPGEDREIFVGTFTGVLSQSDQGQKFMAAFARYHSPVLDLITGNTSPPTPHGKDHH